MTDTDVAGPAAGFHQDVSRESRTNIALREDTAEVVRDIRDLLNEQAGARILNANDVVRIAVVAAARYNALALGDIDGTDALDEEKLVPLTQGMRTVLQGTDGVPDWPDQAAGSGGED